MWGDIVQIKGNTELSVCIPLDDLISVSQELKWAISNVLER